MSDNRSANPWRFALLSHRRVQFREEFVDHFLYDSRSCCEKIRIVVSDRILGGRMDWNRDLGGGLGRDWWGMVGSAGEGGNGSVGDA